jgi:hypothetical protein
MRAPLFIALLAMACAKPEPIERADYFIDNRTAVPLSVSATTHWPSEPQLLADQVPAGTRVLIYQVVQGSGGHTLPSNSFKRFSVYAGDSVVYEGVQNPDWQREGLVAGRHQLVLVIE